MIRRENSMPYANKQLNELVWLKSGGTVSDFAAAIGMSQQRVNRLLVFDKKQDRFPAVSDEVRNACIETFGLEPDYFTPPATEEEVNPLDMLSEEFKNTPSHPDISGPGHTEALIAAKQETIDILKQLLEEKNRTIAALQKQLEDMEKRRLSYMAAEPNK